MGGPSLFRLWCRATGRHAWRPVGPPGSYRECVWRIGGAGDFRHGDWYVRPEGKPPDGKTAKGDEMSDPTPTPEAP